MGAVSLEQVRRCASAQRAEGVCAPLADSTLPSGDAATRARAEAEATAHSRRRLRLDSGAAPTSCGCSAPAVTSALAGGAAAATRRRMRRATAAVRSSEKAQPTEERGGSRVSHLTEALGRCETQPQTHA